MKSHSLVQVLVFSNLLGLTVVFSNNVPLYPVDDYENSNNNYRQGQGLSPEEQKIVQFYDKDRILSNQANSNQNQYAHVDPHSDRGISEHRSTIKKLLKDLLERLDSLEPEDHNNGVDYETESREHRNQHQESNFEHKSQSIPLPRQGLMTNNNNKCSLHGLWLSAVTGVAFQIEPNYSTGFGLKVQILDTGHQAIIKTPHGEESKVITSDWIGSALVSPERSTTISIVLQEKITGPTSDGSIIEPKTAVFVGQCLICSGTPTIQGSWIIFPEAQTCFRESDRPPRADNLYLLRAVN